jgi:hypothetical protein
MAISSPTPVYLVELNDPHLGTFERADVSRFLENAIETVLKHLTEFMEPVEAQVTVDPESQELAGIVFYTEEGEAIAVIRPYYLDREVRECLHDGICRAAGGALSKLEKNLNRTFKR